MLHDFIAVNRDEIIRRCRAKVATRTIPPPSVAELDHGVPLFLEQLAAALRSGVTGNEEIRSSAVHHGHDLLQQEFSVSQVVHDYGDVCQSITELALESAAISTEDFRTLNRCLDDAIAGAVSEYGRGRNRSMQDGESARGNERLGFFAHELGNLINTGIIAFEILKQKRGRRGHRTAQRSCWPAPVVESEIRCLTEGIRTGSGLRTGLIDEVASAPRSTPRQALTPLVSAVDNDAGAAESADPGRSRVEPANARSPRRRPASAAGRRQRERVVIEIEDRCGGLPAGNVGDLFRPFEQRGADRTGAGLGLAFCRWAVEASDGRISARNLPGTGCVFSVDLPRVGAPAAASV